MKTFTAHYHLGQILTIKADSKPDLCDSMMNDAIFAMQQIIQRFNFTEIKMTGQTETKTVYPNEQFG